MRAPDAQRKGKYIGPLPELRDMEAIVRDDEKRGYVLAQFDRQRLYASRIVAKPGEGRDEELPYCFGWHSLPESDFEFAPTPGHRPGCNCLECVPEPHSLDQLRRRF